jgi:hypothetical protein
VSGDIRAALAPQALLPLVCAHGAAAAAAVAGGGAALRALGAGTVRLQHATCVTCAAPQRSSGWLWLVERNGAGESESSTRVRLASPLVSLLAVCTSPLQSPDADPGGVAGARAGGGGGGRAAVARGGHACAARYEAASRRCPFPVRERWRFVVERRALCHAVRGRHGGTERAGLSLAATAAHPSSGAATEATHHHLTTRISSPWCKLMAPLVLVWFTSAGTMALLTATLEAAGPVGAERWQDSPNLPAPALRHLALTALRAALRSSSSLAVAAAQAGTGARLLAAALVSASTSSTRPFRDSRRLLCWTKESPRLGAFSASRSFGTNLAFFFQQASTGQPDKEHPAAPRLEPADVALSLDCLLCLTEGLAAAAAAGGVGAGACAYLLNEDLVRPLVAMVSPARTTALSAQVREPTRHPAAWWAGTTRLPLSPRCWKTQSNDPHEPHVFFGRGLSGVQR